MVKYSSSPSHKSFPKHLFAPLPENSFQKFVYSYNVETKLARVYKFPLDFSLEISLFLKLFSMESATVNHLTWIK